MEKVRDVLRAISYQKKTDRGWLGNSHYLSYFILNLCCIFYTVISGNAGSKKAAAAWVKSNYNIRSHLISSTENWKYGTEFKFAE